MFVFLVLFRNTHSAKYYLVAAPIICQLWNTKCPENYWTTEAVVGAFCKKGVFKNFEKFTGKHLRQCPSLVKFQVKDCNFIKRDSNTGVKYATIILQNISPVESKVYKQRVLLQIIHYYTTGWLLNEAFTVSLWNKTTNSSCSPNAENTVFATLDHKL